VNPKGLLVAADSSVDAQLVRHLLHGEFESVETSCVESAAVADFERVNPAVVLLAFKSLQKAQGYCLGLYRSSQVARLSTHRTIVLCTQSELREAYAVCRDRTFDDYVLFWPMNHDAPRLLMAVHHAIRSIGSGNREVVTASDLAAAARQAAGIEQEVEALTSAGDAAMAQVGRCVEDVETDLKVALRNLAVEAPQSADNAVSRQESIRTKLEHLHSEAIAPRVQEAATRIAAARQAFSAGQARLAPQLDANRKLQGLAGSVRPSVVLVDDDETQCKLIGRALADVQIRSRSCGSARETLRVLGESRPDLILMDINLPDTDGIELTQLVRKLPGYAKVPIVMVTGHSDRVAVMNSMSAGAAGFLVKPLTRQKLYAQVNAALGWPAVPRAIADDAG
jgi:CheY-like chemotaxis protein